MWQSVCTCAMMQSSSVANFSWNHLDFFVAIIVVIVATRCTLWLYKCGQNARCITQPPRMSFESFFLLSRFYVIILCFTVDLCCIHTQQLGELKPWNPIHIICVNERMYLNCHSQSTTNPKCSEIVAILLSWNWVESTSTIMAVVAVVICV